MASSGSSRGAFYLGRGALGVLHLMMRDPERRRALAPMVQVRAKKMTVGQSFSLGQALL